MCSAKTVMDIDIFVWLGIDECNLVAQTWILLAKVGGRQG